MCARTVASMQYNSTMDCTEHDDRVKLWWEQRIQGIQYPPVMQPTHTRRDTHTSFWKVLAVY
jgi:hypothetical protein